VTRAARLLFGLLVVATVGSFFLAQRLKNQPAVVQKVRGSQAFSPDGDGRRDRLAISFVLKRSQPVTVEMVDQAGETVRTLAKERPVTQYRRTTSTFIWDGKDGTGPDARVVDDGIYRLKVVLPDEGRSIVIRYRSFAVRTTPPRPRVLSVASPGAKPHKGPAILPTVDGRSVRATLRLRGWESTARVVRTSPGPAQAVRSLPVTVTRRAPSGTQLRDRKGGPREYRAIEGYADWDGRLEDGTAAPPGTYVVQVCVRDLAGVLGCGPRRDRGGLPAPEENGRMRGQGGITVRPVGVQANPAPVVAGHRLTFFVDARGKRYEWALRRVGTPGVLDRGTSRNAVLKTETESERGALYRLTVRANGRRVDVPAMSNDARKQPVLVVVPAIAWQGLNSLDDDGDGLVNVLTGGETSRASRVKAERVLAAIPRGFDTDVQPVLEWLAKNNKRFEITSDLALAAGDGPKLEGRRGVLLAGEQRWITAGLGDDLRAFVRGGGTVAALDPTGLRRAVTLSQAAREDGGVLRAPGPFVAENAFGLVSRGAVRLDGPPQIDTDDIGLFDGTDGRFEGYPVAWPLDDTNGARVVARAVDTKDHVVIAAVKVGDGFVIRTGLPTFASRLADDSDTSELMDSTWRRLSR
jgi:hypothetical protein